MTATGAVPQVPPGLFCANPQFADSEGPDEGEYYGCQGQVVGVFSYHACGLVQCPDESDPFTAVPIDGAGHNGIIPFGGADDPTEGEEPTTGDPTETSGDSGDEQPDVRTCCDPSIEMAEGGMSEGTDACISECSYAACDTARDQFKALQTDPASWAACDSAPISAQAKLDCKGRVVASFKHFESVVANNMEMCAATVQDETPGTVFGLGNPGCSEGTVKAGCIVHATLDMTCNDVSILFDSNSRTCEEALHQPLVPTSQDCTIDVGGGQVRVDNSLFSADLKYGSAVTRYFDCGAALCPFVLDGLDVGIDDMDDGTSFLTNLTAELVVAAYGQSDGEYMSFDPGALRIRVQGTLTDGTGSAPFEALGASSQVATGSHHWDLLNLGYVYFEAGGYSFQTYIEEAACVNM